MLQPAIPTQLDATLASIDALMHTQPDEALHLCEQVFVDARKLQKPLAQVVAAERFGLIMDHRGRGVEARNTLFEAVQVAQSARLFANEAKLLEQIARGYYTAGDYRQAIQYWVRCQEVSDQAGKDARTWLLAKVGLAQVYFALNDYYSGLALLEEAESRIQEVDDAHLDAKIKINVGVALGKTGRGKEASVAFLGALEICTRHGYLDYAAESNFRLGQLELDNGMYDAAMTYLDAALVQARQVNYRWVEAHILATQAETYAHRGEYPMAMENINAAQGIATVDGFEHMLADQQFAASRYAEAMGDFQTALREFRGGFDCQQRMLASSASERNKDLEEKTGLRPSVSRLLVELANNHLIEEGRLDPAFHLITQESSRILNVERASIWLLDRQTGTLVCRNLYLADRGEYAREKVWRRKDCALYFDRLTDRNPIVAHDAMHHPHTSMLDLFYLNERDIKSMLVFPIWLAGQTTGILCFEAVGTQRNWTPDDLLHGSQLTEVAARVISGYERKQFQQEISTLNARMMQVNEMLEARIMERTASLERHTVELHEMHDKLYQSRQQLRQAEKMASLGRVAATGITEVEAPVSRIVSGLSALDIHHKNLLSLLASYEAAETGLPDTARNQLAILKRDCGLDSLRDELSQLTQKSRQDITRVQSFMTYLRDVPNVDPEEATTPQKN